MEDETRESHEIANEKTRVPSPTVQNEVRKEETKMREEDEDERQNENAQREK